ncbi:alkaline phosphatase family protein, partial [Georgenia sp. 10Sc9-8]|nr:alkaline phosphatase family protein [Georgenia halotolerans]
MPSPLLLGPMLRHVDETSAAVWVETAVDAVVTVRLTGSDAGPHVWRARTFTVHGHHYALVEVTGLRPGEQTPYEVLIDDEVCWPEPDSPFPPSTITTPTKDSA